MYSDSYNKAFEVVIGHEQGYVNDPDDPGGETKYGITKRAFPNEDIKNLTLERAKEIYYNNYWNTKKMNLDEISKFDEKIAIKLFDQGVNQGMKIAAEFLQTAINLTLKNINLLKVDGFAGNNTIFMLNKINKKDKDVLIKIIKGLQFKRYYDIIINNNNLIKYVKGWVRRI